MKLLFSGWVCVARALREGGLLTAANIPNWK